MLGVLDNIDIFGESLDLGVVALHFIMQRQEFKGVPAGAPRLEVCKEVFLADLSVYGVRVP